mgnify:CR=1 FL=1
MTQTIERNSVIPVIPINTEYSLTLGEQKIAHRIARARFRNARDNGVPNGKMGSQSNFQTDLYGMGAEIAFCQIFGTKVDLKVKLHSAKLGTDPYDTEFELLKLPVDVKHTDWTTGSLLAVPEKQPGDYLFALINGCFPDFRFKGFAWANQLLIESNKKNLGHGESYVMRQHELRTLEEVLNDERYNRSIRKLLPAS